MKEEVGYWKWFRTTFIQFVKLYKYVPKQFVFYFVWSFLIIAIASVLDIIFDIYYSKEIYIVCAFGIIWIVGLIFGVSYFIYLDER